MPEATFDRCYRCNYSLKGLPAVHRCPECGEPYDDQVRIWRPRRRYSIAAVMFVVYGVFLVRSWGSIGLELAGGGSVGAFDTAQALFWLVIAVGTCITISRERRHGRLAAITRLGVYVRDRANKAMLVPWSEVTRVTVKSETVYLENTAGRRTRHIEVDLFGEKQRDDAEAFAVAVREAKGRFGGPIATSAPEE